MGNELQSKRERLREEDDDVSKSLKSVRGLKTDKPFVLLYFGDNQKDGVFLSTEAKTPFRI